MEWIFSRPTNESSLTHSYWEMCLCGKSPEIYWLLSLEPVLVCRSLMQCLLLLLCFIIISWDTMAYVRPFCHQVGCTCGMRPSLVHVGLTYLLKEILLFHVDILVIYQHPWHRSVVGGCHRRILDLQLPGHDRIVMTSF